MVNAIGNALVGTGGDASEVVKDESRLLAMGISKVAQPKNRKKTGERIARSFESKFKALSEDQTQGDHLGKPGSTGVRWYRADSKFLYGVAPDSDMRQASAETLLNIYYHTKKIEGKTRIVVDFNHPRKQQRVAITTKVTVKKSTLNRAIAIAKLAIGKLPASWFATAKKIKPALVAPQWIERHIKGNKTTKSITDISRMAIPESPSITLGSRAVGVSKFSRPIQFAIDLRAKKMNARLNLILSGYSRDVASGIRAHRHAHKVKGVE